MGDILLLGNPRFSDASRPPSFDSPSAVTHKNRNALRHGFVMSCAGWENRTPDPSLENSYFTTKLIPHLLHATYPIRKSELTAMMKGFLTLLLSLLPQCCLLLVYMLSFQSRIACICVLCATLPSRNPLGLAPLAPDSALPCLQALHLHACSIGKSGNGWYSHCLPPPLRSSHK